MFQSIIAERVWTHRVINSWKSKSPSKERNDQVKIHPSMIKEAHLPQFQLTLTRPSVDLTAHYSEGFVV